MIEIKSASWGKPSALCQPRDADLGIAETEWVIKALTRPRKVSNFFLRYSTGAIRNRPVLLRGELDAAISWVQYLGCNILD